jgi:hypothetical protein
VTITQLEIRFKTKVSHKHMVVIYHRNTPLPKVRKGLDRYKFIHGNGKEFSCYTQLNTTVVKYKQKSVTGEDVRDLGDPSLAIRKATTTPVPI